MPTNMKKLISEGIYPTHADSMHHISLKACFQSEHSLLARWRPEQ
jgi:hypothetical protein